MTNREITQLTLRRLLGINYYIYTTKYRLAFTRFILDGAFISRYSFVFLNTTVWNKTLVQ